MIKYLLQITLFLAMTPAAASDKVATSDKTSNVTSPAKVEVKADAKSAGAPVVTAPVIPAVDPELAPIKELCVKNAKPEAVKAFNVDTVCECSVKRTLEFLRGEDHKEKDLKLRIEWLKKMYEMKLSQAEIDADTYEIFEFNVPITETCIEEQNAQRSN